MRRLSTFKTYHFFQPSALYESGSKIWQNLISLQWLHETLYDRNMHYQVYLLHFHLKTHQQMPTLTGKVGAWKHIFENVVPCKHCMPDATATIAADVFEKPFNFGHIGVDGAPHYEDGFLSHTSTAAPTASNSVVCSPLEQSWGVFFAKKSPPMTSVCVLAFTKSYDLRQYDVSCQPQFSSPDKSTTEVFSPSL